MVQVGINLPEEVLNRLNNYYLQNFGYEIHTQLINFLIEDIERSKDYPSSKVSSVVPAIRKCGRGYVLVLISDGKQRYTRLNSWDDALKVMNEWSKYGFDMKKRDVALSKVVPLKEPKKPKKPKEPKEPEKLCIWWKDKKYMVANTINNHIYRFGRFKTIEDAIRVKQFVEKHDWDKKYCFTNVIKEHPEVHQYNYADYMLSLAKEEGF